jgi:UDP-glucuronate decarboxylase
MKTIVTGGAGFIGSHLVDRLMEAGHSVVCIDNLYTGQVSNNAQWKDHPNFQFIEHDVVTPIEVEQVDQIYHLACPASPVHYQADPIKTAKTNFLGTLNMLELAKKYNARLLLASTSEVYGDPLIHPQNEDYWGNVNCTGIRSCYDEGKRIAETLTFDYHRHFGVEVRVARIFNTHGVRMLENDGRVVSNFVVQALKGIPLTIYGDGSQTRSFCYVSDLVEGLIRLMNGNYIGPVNLGNPGEYTILQLAQTIQRLIDPTAELVFKPLPQDDPQRRQPDIARAKFHLDWEPKVPLEEGLSKTIAYFRELIASQGSNDFAVK